MSNEVRVSNTEPVPPTPEPAAATRDVADLSYEQARDELVQVVTSLEQGTASLEDSLALWERGEQLAARCQEWLDGARERLAKAQSATESQPETGDAQDEA